MYLGAVCLGLLAIDIGDGVCIDGPNIWTVFLGSMGKGLMEQCCQGIFSFLVHVYGSKIVSKKFWSVLESAIVKVIPTVGAAE
jgi:hypothetical protein